MSQKHSLSNPSFTTTMGGTIKNSLTSITSSSNKTIRIVKKLSFNPLTPGSDSHVTSHYNI